MYCLFACFYQLNETLPSFLKKIYSSYSLQFNMRITNFVFMSEDIYKGTPKVIFSVQWNNRFVVTFMLSCSVRMNLYKAIHSVFF